MDLMEPIQRLDKDLKSAAKLIGKKEAQYLVDAYYITQKNRIRADAQVRAMVGEPNRLIQWVADSEGTFENDFKRALDVFTDEYTVGRWMKSICGIGPVISAGLLAQLDITKAPNCCHFWTFAGLNPNSKWEKGHKRPWNADLKCLVNFKLGECFVKVQNNENDYYGKIYKERKRYEIRNNASGNLAEYALLQLKQKKYSKDTDAYAFYSGAFPGSIWSDWEHLSTAQRTAKMNQLKVTPEDWSEFPFASEDTRPIEEIRRIQSIMVHCPTTINGQTVKGIPMLPPAHIHARARKWAVRMFLSHLHHVMFEDYYGTTAPRPYIFSDPKHSHFIPPPNWPFEDKGKSLKEMKE